jgi:LCP family protein required for cell wall assembly
MDEEPTIKRPPIASKAWMPPSQPQQHGSPIYRTNSEGYRTARRAQNKRKKRPRAASSIIFTILGLTALFSCGVLSVGYYYYSNIHQPLANFIRPVSRGTNEPAINATPAYDVIKGRSWNILLLGSDNDQKYTFPALLTQVMMVIHIDTVTNSVYMVSIPRDSWVSVPEVGGMHKIDQAFLLGVNQNNTFDSGVRLARLTIERDYGITIDRYAWVGLNGFARVIDTLGGIDVNVTHPIVDDTYPDDTGQGADPNDPYAFKRLYLAPGPQHLNGDQALEYVRSRHADLVGDISRTQRQQQVLQALKQKLTVATVVNNLPALIKDLTGVVYTDLSEAEMLAFANFGRALSDTAIQRITLGPGIGNQDYGDYQSVYDPSIGSYQDVIIPRCDTIQPTINHIFGLADIALSCNVTGGL